MGLPGEPIAELTKLGWVILSPGKENASTNILFTKTSLHDYENLCSLDSLGIEEKCEKNREFVYGEFRKQLGQDSLGNYETNLIWKKNHPLLRNNEMNSLGRLHSLTKNLIRSNKLGEYDKIIQEQINEGIIEKMRETKKSEKGKEFYLPHRPVIREFAETTKIRIVYDASAKPIKDSVSLNECLETGPPLQNSLWDILIRSRFRPILLCGNIEKAFLQTGIRESKRDVLRFHWVKNSDPNVVEINRFTRLVFGLTQSPFILESTLKEHFQYYINEYPTLIEAISEDMYVDDLVSGSNTIEEVEVIKQKSIDLFRKGGFNLHKWHSDIPLLQSSNTKSESELAYAKEKFKNTTDLTNILGVPCDKNRDNLSIVVPEFNEKLITKRNVLSYIASIYDTLGLTSASHIIGKVIYRELCDKKRSWDTEIPQILKEKFKKWVSDITNIPIEIPRSIPTHKESITSVDLHVFGDASIIANCAAVYAVVNQPPAISKGLVASKSRISKRDLTIPRLELVSTHMACNLVSNVKSALKYRNVRYVTGWTDSTVVLYWLNWQGSYNQFVQNGVNKILKRDDINWQYVPTRDNPADLGSRGSLLTKISEIWWEGPFWLQLKENWPRQPDIKSSEESEKEVKISKEHKSNVFTTVAIQDDFDLILHKFDIHKTLRISAWILRLSTTVKKIRNQVH